ncbi:MAG: anthranilate synthase component I [Ignavibacteriales bacterium]
MFLVMSLLMLFRKSTLEEFSRLSRSFNLIPVYEFIPADMLTPVLAYMRIRRKGVFTFLLESVEDTLNFGRYSFIGLNPVKELYNYRKKTFLRYEEAVAEIPDTDIFTALKRELEGITQPQIEGLPYFKGGAAGFIGYENTELFEPSLGSSEQKSSIPDSYLGIFRDLIAFDHLKHQLILISNVHVKPDQSAQEQFSQSQERLANLKQLLSSIVPHPGPFSITSYIKQEIDSNRFTESFDRIKEHILDGDVFQLVLSEKFSAEYSGDPFHVYRTLRMINPSPYMYILEMPGEIKVIGTSPEDLVRVKDGKATILPIAGTRRRGTTTEDDNRLAEELIHDPKENAEHTMLVDLARNDLGRVCSYGSVSLTEDRTIKLYSHVMHIVSRVEGKVRDDISTVDVLAASFPAGTVTGAPKVRAMEIIKKLEPEPRGLYAGAVGYFDYSGNMDMCIAIRSFFIRENIITWQAGAGIVLDSQPELEMKEIYNKARVMTEAILAAGRIDEHTRH